MFSEYHFNILSIEFEEIYKIITRKNASKDSKKVAERRTFLIEIYNKIINQTKECYLTNLKTVKRIRPRVVEIRDKTIKCLGILNSDIEVPKDLTKTISTVKPTPVPAPIPTPVVVPEPIPTPSPIVHIDPNPSPNPNPIPNRNMDEFDFILKLSQLIRKPFTGDPLCLDAFIESIELAELGTSEALKPTLVKFLKSKLEGKAKEAVPTDATTVAEIKNALKAKVKPENTAVVMGRLLALRCDREKLQNFQEKAEDLADRLRRAYISDGMPAELAKSLTIEKTIEMCRSSARTQLVKSVLASTHFSEPSDVLAKYVVEVANENRETKEAQVLKFTSNRGRGRGYSRGYNNNYNNQNRNYNYQNNGYNRGNSWHNNGRGRGRGRGRGGNYNRGNQNGQNERYVRIFEAENAPAPSQERGENHQNVLTIRRMTQ